LRKGAFARDLFLWFERARWPSASGLPIARVGFSPDKGREQTYSRTRDALYRAFPMEHLAVQIIFTPILSLGLLPDPRLFPAT